MKQRGLGIYAGSALLFLHAPLLILIVFSFNDNRLTVWQGLGWI